MVSLPALGGVKNGRWVSRLGHCSPSRRSMPLPSSLLCIAVVAGDQGLTKAQKGPPSSFQCPPTPASEAQTAHLPGPTATAPPSGHPGEVYFLKPTGILDYNPLGGETG